ncbi:hypothetical protein [Brachybacterium sp. Marseille-Q7125]|uniref:hypothetical protein n=1 Tax=Brachybacterium sp. Marseille-Q7125 TaxID=2932815 RepID=UPI001FF1304C|nr:hypothetical protein [Brachybacterium sp. Marseille-Q7125]
MSRRWQAKSTSLLPEWAAVLQLGNIVLGAAGLVALVAMRNIARDTHRPVWSAFMGVFGLGPSLLWLLVKLVIEF